MNEQDKAQLDALKQRQDAIQSDLDGLREMIHEFELHLQQIAPAEIDAMEIPPFPIPPLDPETAQFPESTAVPPLIPPVIPELRTPMPETASAPAEPSPAIPPPIPPVVEYAQSRSDEPATETESQLEMRLGTYWFVRAGIVLLLTGLAFLANYAYVHWVGQLGPAGKVTLLYFASALLLGTGAWLQRKGVKESLRNYGQVVFAGGLAAVYFVTYAAHHMPALRVIESTIVDSILLLGWAAFIVFLAERRKSELLALFAIGLAYYTSIITSVGLFTLYSNLILTIAAVFFLLRNRWTTLSVASLIATYASFVFWRFYAEGDWTLAARNELLYGNVFLGSYWVVFTFAAFLSHAKQLTRAGRILFISFNNAACFALVVLSMLQISTVDFWKFSLGFGAVLLLLSLAAKKFLADEPGTKNAYLAQGLILVTVGLIAHFTGFKLALILAAESVSLLWLGYQTRNPVLHIGAWLSGFLATGLATTNMSHEPSALFGAGVGALMVFNAIWARRQNRNFEAIDAATAFFAALGTFLWLLTTIKVAPSQWIAPLLACEALLLTLFLYPFRTREIVMAGQLFLVLAQLNVFADAGSARFWQEFLPVLAITVLLGHWWQRQKTMVVASEIRVVFEIIYALAAVGMLYSWVSSRLMQFDAWMAIASALAVAVTGYGLLTRAWFLAAAGQLFTAAAVGAFAKELLQGHPAWYWPLAPIALLLLFSAIANVWSKRQAVGNEQSGKPLLTLAQVYRWCALLLSLCWIYEYVSVEHQVWVLMLVGALLFVVTGLRKNAEGLLASAIYFAAGMGLFAVTTVDNATLVRWPNLLAILLLPALQQFAKRNPEFYRLTPQTHAFMLTSAGVALWMYVSRVVIEHSGGTHFYVTASWAGFALVVFAAGLILRERSIRWFGLIVLGCTIGRVMLSDVWKLDSIYRILSFVVLGLVLLVLGFVYNKYQEKIKEWI